MASTDVRVAERLAERGLTIPPPQVVPAGVRLTYRRLVRWQNVAYIAGHGPTHGEGWGSPLGKVGREVTVDEAVAAAQLTALSVLGTIARELRKFYVTMLVVDQRPSGIDAEVLSQIGTRITCQLNDERDIDAIFTGVSGGSHLRTVLATLDSREQALVLGHAVPMPMMVRTRKYDPTFYATVGGDDGAVILSRARRYEEIFGVDG